MEAGVDAVVVEAFDINDVANDVYEHNFGHRPYQVAFFSLLDYEFIYIMHVRSDSFSLLGLCSSYDR